MITVAVSGGQTALNHLQRMCAGLAPGGQPVRVVEAGVLSGPASILVALEAPSRPLAADILVATGESAVQAARQCGADCLVTVGLSTRDTITPSSVLDGCMATLQREISGPGGVASPRELNLSALKGTVDEKMAVAATLLLLDPNASLE